jgi:hypothetical protein
MSVTLDPGEVATRAPSPRRTGDGTYGPERPPELGSRSAPPPRPARPLRRWWRAAAVLLLASLVLGVRAPVTRDGIGQELVVNGSFEKGLSGWRTNRADTTLQLSSSAKTGKAAAVLAPAPGTTAVLNDAQSTVTSTRKGTHYTVSAWLRTDRPRLSGQVRVFEVGPAGTRPVTQSFRLTDRAWHHVIFSLTAAEDGSALDLNVLGWNLQEGQRLYVDSVSLVQTLAVSAPAPTPLPAPSPPRPTVPAQPNEVRISARGVPRSGALFGAAVGSNSDPARFEAQIGQRLGVRRTFWGADQVDQAVAVARQDLAQGRLPWISFKLPYSWGKMTAGVGDAWTLDLTAKLAQLPGPVWVAFHHEPEGDGRLQDWTAMQERLGPMVRQGAPNVGFTVILTGWHQLFGPDKHSLDSIWPDTKVDVAGFDIYNKYGTTPDGHKITTVTDMRATYFEPLSRWAKKKGVAWGLAETGVNDAASKRYPLLIQRTYADLVATGGVALSYFNTTLNSTSSWAITSSTKLDQFARTLKHSPTFPRKV